MLPTLPTRVPIPPQFFLTEVKVSFVEKGKTMSTNLTLYPRTAAMLLTRENDIEYNKCYPGLEQKEDLRQGSNLSFDKFKAKYEEFGFSASEVWQNSPMLCAIRSIVGQENSYSSEDAIGGVVIFSRLLTPTIRRNGALELGRFHRDDANRWQCVR